ncbi:MAG: acyloxyacyl hydrolase [Candidatus Omnitrophica bacterium]|nr:acyloxyacyl hydrolase [Candidatus Omnitrophota bacterium]
MALSKKIYTTVVIITFLFILADYSYCYGQGGEKIYKKEFGVFSGWMDGNLKKQDDYKMIPLYLQIGFDITPSFDKMKRVGSLKFLFEPFFNTVLSPDKNIEAGNNFILKYSQPIIQKLSIYVEGGLGMMFMSQHTTEQGTQFNFTELVGGGISYFFAKNKAVNFGYRYRHFSNAGIKQPNKGVEMDGLLFGVSIVY